MRRVCRLSVLVAVLATVGSNISSSAGEPVAIELSDLVGSMLSRPDAIRSGRMTYKTMSNLFPDRVDTFDFVMSGKKWRLDDRVMGITYVNVPGSFLELHRTPQPVGPPTNSATFGSEKSVEFRNPYPPYFAGSFWYRGDRAPAQYIRHHTKEGKLAGETEIDGVRCFVLEWPIPKKDVYSAFHTIINPLSDGGILRVYVSRTFGYALPRVEYLTLKGTVTTRFEASDFRPVGAGLFIPAKLKLQTFPEAGKKGYLQEYEIEKMTDINEPIPDNAFVVTLPPDTSVSFTKDAIRKPGK